MAAEIDLNDLVVKDGETFDETKSITKENEEAEVILNKMIQSAEPVPGQSVPMPNSDDVTLDKEEAEKEMIYKLAEEKLRKEREAFNRKSDNEKINDYLRDMEYYRHTNDFFRKNGYEMSGQQKRVLKRKIDRAIAKGKFKLTEDQRQDILYELNKPTNSMPKNAANDVIGNDNVVKNLDSLITTI